MISDRDLAPLLHAVPSYEPSWRQEREGVPADRIAHEFCLWLAAHLADRAAAGDFSEFGPMFAALDRLYRTGDDELDTRLTVGFLESLIYLAEDRGVDLASIARHITGWEARKGWDAAYAYTHGGRSGPA